MKRLRLSFIFENKSTCARVAAMTTVAHNKTVQPNPVNEDQLRIISLTSYLSKQFEQFIVIWLLKYVSSQMDWGQYGGIKGTSISHYLIDFVNYILFNQDLSIPQAAKHLTELTTILSSPYLVRLGFLAGS